MVLDWFALGIKREGPEAIQVDLFTEAGGHSIHQQSSSGTLNLDIVGQPIPVDKG